MFFTSALTPRGAPGSCTDTLASTLIWPSAEQKRTRAERVGGGGSVRERRAETVGTGHVALTGADGLQDELQLPDRRRRLLSAAHVGLHHQLHETYT